MQNEARISQLITDFARLDPSADGTVSVREFHAALAKHGGFDSNTLDSLARKFGVARASFSDLPRTAEVDYVAFLAYLEEAATPTVAMEPALQPRRQQTGLGLREGGNPNTMMTHQQQQQQLQPQSQKQHSKSTTNFVDRALSNASRALLSHTAAGNSERENAVSSSENSFLRLQQQQAPLPSARTLGFGDVNLVPEQRFEDLLQRVAAGPALPAQQHPHHQMQSSNQNAVSSPFQSPPPKQQQQATTALDALMNSVALSPLTPGSRSFLQQQHSQNQPLYSAESTPNNNAQNQQQQQRHHLQQQFVSFASTSPTPVPARSPPPPPVQQQQFLANKQQNDDAHDEHAVSFVHRKSVPLSFMFARLDRDGDGFITLQDLVSVLPTLRGGRGVPCDRLELEFLVEGIVESSSSSSSNNQNVEDAKLDPQLFSVLAARLKPNAMLALRDPATWSSLSSEQERVENQHQQQVATTTTPPPVTFASSSSRLDQQRHHQRKLREQEQQQQQQQPKAKTHQQQQQQQQHESSKIKKKSSSSSSSPPLASSGLSFMRPTTSSCLRTGKYTSDMHVPQPATTTTTTARGDKKDSNARPSSSSAAPCKAATNNNNNNKLSRGNSNNSDGRSVSIDLRRSSSSSANVAVAPAASSSSSSPRMMPSRSPSSPAPRVHEHQHQQNNNQGPPSERAHRIPVTIAALFRSKAHHVMSLCQIVDKHQTGFIPSDKLLEVLRTIHPTAPEAELSAAVSVAISRHSTSSSTGKSQLVVDYGDFARLLLAAGSSSSTTSQAASSPPPPSQRVAITEDAVTAAVSPASTARSRSSPQHQQHQAQPQQQQQQQPDASDTLRQMLRSELDRVTRSTPQRFIDCLLAASKQSRQHRTKEYWMVRSAELLEALAAVYGQYHSSSGNGGGAASSSPAAKSQQQQHQQQVIYASPPDWVVTRSRKIAQMPFQPAPASALSPGFSIAGSPRAKQCRRRAHEWMVANPDLKPNEWCDAAFLLETLYLE